MARLKLLDAILVALFAGMLALNVLQVVFRYLLHNPLYWSEEAAIYMMVVMVFLAVGVLTRDREHIVIDLLGSMPQGRALRLLDIAQFLITALIMGVFAALSIEYLLSVIARNANSTALRLPMWVPVISMPLGFVAGTLVALVNAVRMPGARHEKAAR